jgi:hypothetical protein
MRALTNRYKSIVARRATILAAALVIGVTGLTTAAAAASPTSSWQPGDPAYCTEASVRITFRGGGSWNSSFSAYARCYTDAGPVLVARLKRNGVIVAEARSQGAVLPTWPAQALVEKNWPIFCGSTYQATVHVYIGGHPLFVTTGSPTRYC